MARKILFICILTISVCIFGCSDSKDSRSYSSDWLGIKQIPADSRITVKLGDQNPFVATAIPVVIGVFDKVGAPIADAPLLLTSNNGGKFDDEALDTDDKGYAKAIFTPENAGTTIITAAAEGCFGNATVQVSPNINPSATVSIFASSDDINTGETILIQVFGANSNGVNFDAVPVNLICSVGSLDETVGSLADGWFTAEYTAPNATGVATITAMVQGVTTITTISVQ